MGSAADRSPTSYRFPSTLKEHRMTVLYTFDVF